MRKLRYIILIIMLSLPLYGYTLKGGVKYTVEQARKEAFADVEYRLPQSVIEPYLYDPNFKENQRALGKGYIDLGDRYIGFFIDDSYAILYKNNMYYEYYYRPDGKLDMIGKRTSSSYPAKSFKYDINGKLKSVILYIKKGNSYVFSPDGQLKGHWVGNKCYDINGNQLTEKY